MLQNQFDFCSSCRVAGSGIWNARRLSQYGDIQIKDAESTFAILAVCAVELFALKLHLEWEGCGSAAYFRGAEANFGGTRCENFGKSSGRGAFRHHGNAINMSCDH